MYVKHDCFKNPSPLFSVTQAIVIVAKMVRQIKRYSKESITLLDSLIADFYSNTPFLISSVCV